jgi:hypothetical protein
VAQVVDHLLANVRPSVQTPELQTKQKTNKQNIEAKNENQKQRK